MEVLVAEQILSDVFGNEEEESANETLFIYAFIFSSVIMAYSGFYDPVVGIETTQIASAAVLISISVGLWVSDVLTAINNVSWHISNIFIGNSVAVADIGWGLLCVEILSVATRAVSLGLRLFANLIAGNIIEGLVETNVYSLLNITALTAGKSLLAAIVLYTSYNELISFSQNIAVLV